MKHCMNKLVVGAALLALMTAANAQEVKTVPSVVLSRYAGTWHEIARLPNRFQAKCVGNVTADYTLQADGGISVRNRCKTADGKTEEVLGEAKVADPVSNARLKVRFAPAWLSWLPMVWADYWIIDLASDYTTAVVGDPDRAYLWVLARTPSLPDAVYQDIVDRATAQGYDTARLVRTRNDP